MQASLAQHLPRDDPAGVAAFLDEVTRSIEASWGVSLAAAVGASQEPPQQAGAAAAGDQAAAAAAAALPPPKLEPVLAGATGTVPSGISQQQQQQHQLAFGGVPAGMAQPGLPGMLLPPGVLAGGQMLMPSQGLPANGPCLPGMAQSLLPGGIKAESVGGGSGMGAPGLVLPPGGMTALLQGSMGPGDANGLVITAAHHQLLGGAPAAVPVPAPAAQQ